MKYIINKFLNKPIYAIEYRWNLENEKTLWVVYKKFSKRSLRDERMKEFSNEECNSSFMEFKSIDF